MPALNRSHLQHFMFQRCYAGLGEIRRVWDVYLDDNDMTRDQCPIKGVFADAVEEPAVDVEVVA